MTRYAVPGPPVQLPHALPAPLPGPATAVRGRDLRDWLHATSLPATRTGEASVGPTTLMVSCV